MIKRSRPGAHFAVMAGLFIGLAMSALQALEPRIWIMTDGRTVEAEFKEISGTQVTLLDKENRRITVEKAMLSFGDLDYIKENSPPEKPAGFASLLNGPPALPNPAKQAKIDLKLFTKSAATFAIGVDEPFQVLETPHFKIMYGKPLEPGEIAELAERLWLDTAFFHGTFAPKFRQRKMAVFLCANDSAYEGIGAWVADAMVKAGNAEDAEKSKAAWPKSGTEDFWLTPAIAEQNGLFQYARVMRGYRPASAGQPRTEMVRGVFDPYRVHFLAEDLLCLQAGNVQPNGMKGYMALTMGHGYYKEILLTGRSDSTMLGTTVSSGGGASVSTTGGFKDSRNWAQELKRQIRKGEIKPSLDRLFALDEATMDEKSTVLAYAFARYLESTPARLSAFDKLFEQISSSGQIPAPDDFAKIYGFADGKALEADWIKYLAGPEFR